MPLKDKIAKQKHDQNYYCKNHVKRLKQMRKYRERNRTQINTYLRKWYRNGGAKIKRKRRLKIQYNLSIKQFKRLLKYQNYSCAICKITKSDGRWKTFNIDHEHDRQKVRGLLCTSCNMMLSMLEKRPQLLKLCKPFMKYLTNPPAEMASCDPPLMTADYNE
jgi:hypothetical protein